MASFLEKLKRGMDVEESAESTEEKSSPPTPPVKKEKAIKPKKEKLVQEKKKIKIETKPIEKKTEKQEEKPSSLKYEEGELVVDFYQTENDLVVRSAIAGIEAKDLDIVIEKDVVSIKGIRQKPSEEAADYFSQECFWGPFRKEIILPVEIDPNRSQAAMKDGVLVIRMPKIMREKKKKLDVKS